MERGRLDQSSGARGNRAPREGAFDELVPVELEVIEKLEEVNGTRVIHVYLLKNFEETSRLMGWWGWWVSGLVHVGMDG